MALPTVIVAGDPGHIQDHVEIHTLLDRLDGAPGPQTFYATGVAQGLLAQRPAATSCVGLIYHATDVPATYYSDGASWKTWVLTSNANQFTAINEFLGAVRFGSGKPWIDVTHSTYGAQGDNLNDDTAEIQAAIDTVPNSAIAYVIYFPSGIYKISAALVIRTGQRIVFRGAGAVSGSDSCSTITTTNANINLVDAGTNLTNTFSAEDLQFEGAGKATGTGNGIVLGRSGTSAFDSRITRCWFTGIPDSAIRGTQMHGYHIVDCGIENSAVGVRVSIGDNNLISNTRFYSCTTGVRIELGSWNDIKVCKFDFCGAANETTGAVVIDNTTGTECRANSVTVNTFNKNYNDIVLLGYAGDSYGDHKGVVATDITGNKTDFANRRFVYNSNARGTSVTANKIHDAGQQTHNTYAAVEFAGNFSHGAFIFGNSVSLESSTTQVQYGLLISSATLTDVCIGPNDFQGATLDASIACNFLAPNFGTYAPVIATASLPAANNRYGNSTAGMFVIEDVGGGDFGFVIYSQGGRKRWAAGGGTGF